MDVDKDNWWNDKTTIGVTSLTQKMLYSEAKLRGIKRTKFTTIFLDSVCKLIKKGELDKLLKNVYSREFKKWKKL